MAEFWSALVVLLLLCASAAVGFCVRPLIPEAHRSAASTDLIRLVVGMPVTFSALVLGLLTTSVKDTFDNAERDRGLYAAQLTELDRCLRNYGQAADPIRRQLQDYTAGVIASAWPDERRPAGLERLDTASMPRLGESRALGRILNGIDLDIRRLQPLDAFQARLATDCSALMTEVVKRRWG